MVLRNGSVIQEYKNRLKKRKKREHLRSLLTCFSTSEIKPATERSNSAELFRRRCRREGLANLNTVESCFRRLKRRVKLVFNQKAIARDRV